MIYDRINSQHKKGLINNPYLQFVKAERLDLQQVLPERDRISGDNPC